MFECRVELELRGIPAQAWHLSTAEHILGESCWIERLHPRTRSRDDLATFRLSGRTHDPAHIRRATILEIVEQIPSRISSEAPTIRMLTFPISVVITRADMIQPVSIGFQADTDRDRSCAGNPPGPDQGPVRGRPPTRP